jgi:hypothetical protein
MVSCGLDAPGLGQGSVAGSCEQGNEPSSVEFLSSCVMVVLCYVMLR